MNAREDVGAMIDDRARLVRAHVCLRNDRLVVERREGSAGSKKNPHPGCWVGMCKKTMPHAPHLAKESS
jgi:hypothetical protein